MLDETVYECYLRIGATRRRANRVIRCGLGRTPNIKRDISAVAIEFVSDRKKSVERDYEIKRLEYMAIGVEEYWVIDRFDRSMTIFRRNAEELRIEENESYESPLLPGFV